MALAEPAPPPPSAARVDDFPFPVWAGVLPNGMEVWIQPREGTGSLLAMVDVRSGSRFEDKDSSGQSHLLEHLLLDGTERWNERELRHVIQDQGGKFNAWTWPEHVRYYGQVPNGDLPTLLDWLDQVVFKAAIPAEKVAKERAVVFEERSGGIPVGIAIARRWGLALDLSDTIAGAMYPGSALALPVAGRDDALDAVTHEALLQRYRSFYTPSNATLLVLGDLGEAARAAGGAPPTGDDEVASWVMGLAQARFGGLPSGARAEAPASPPLPALDGAVRQVSYFRFDTRVGVCFAARTAGQEDPGHHVAEVVGRYLRDQLYEELREERGLVYSISAWSEEYSDVGHMRLYVESEARHRDTIVATIRAAVGALKAGKVDAGRLARVRAEARGNFLLSKEANLARANWLADYAGRGPENPRNARPDLAYAAVDEAALVAAAQSWFSSERSGFWIDTPILLTGLGRGMAVGFAIFVSSGGWAVWRLFRSVQSRREDGMG